MLNYEELHPDVAAVYAIIELSDKEIADLKSIDIPIDGKFVDSFYHPQRLSHFSCSKEYLVSLVQSSDNQYVVKVKTSIPCIGPSNNPASSVSDIGVRDFDENVGRVVNTYLTECFKEEIRPPRRGFITSEEFFTIIQGASWVWYTETENAEIIGLRAILRYDDTEPNNPTIKLQSFNTKEGVLHQENAGVAPNSVRGFMVAVRDKLSVMLGKKKYQAVCESRDSRSLVTIGLDYDGTVTSDYYGFTYMAKLFKDRGHKVYLVTMRYLSECKNDPMFMQLADIVDGYLATGREAKRQFTEKHGVKIDIWIDDNPMAVEKSAEEIWGVASPEGTIVIEQHGASRIVDNSV